MLAELRQEETYQTIVHSWWTEIKEKDELEGALVVAVHPKLAQYTPECGLELAVQNDDPWQPRERKSFFKPNRHRVSQRETYQEHISRLLRAYQVTRNFYDDIHRQYVTRQALKDDLSYSFARIEQTLGLSSGTLDTTVRYAIAGHDVGKLNEGWQAWMHRWQEHELIDNPAPVTEMIARPDNDGSDEQYTAQQNLRPKRPSHAAESAYSLEVLIMSHNKKLQPIVQNRGFQQIATAIRHSTVLAQYYRYHHQSKEKVYDIRYGLGQDLLRKGKYPQEFIKELGKFLVSYSNENAMEREQAAKRGENIRRRPDVSTDAINEIVRLIDDYEGDSELICNLLVAYGYASDYAKKQDKSDDS